MSLLSRASLKTRLAVACASAITLSSSSAFAAATTVREPAWGLPHIYGATDLELARENGREIAKDRMGQLILLARAGRGSLAQAFGALDPSFVQTDIETRLAGYTSSELNRMFDRLPAASRALILEYCKGVNDTLDTMYSAQDRPIEISVLRSGLLNLGADLFGNATNVSDQVDPYYKAPGGADPEHPNGGFQFTPEMAMSIAVLQVRNFGLNTFEEEKRLAELLALEDVHGGGDGQDIWRDLNFLTDPLAPVSVPDPTTPGYGGPLSDNTTQHDAIVAADLGTRWPDHDWAASAAGIKSKAERREELLKRWSAWPKLGSYGWVIAANRSSTGHPWLGGFPQTGIQTPSLMHYVENRSGEGISGNGMEFVGGPYVLIGHTDSVAYTTTTAQLRIIDTFFETIINENTDAVRYNDEGNPAALNKRIEIIKRGGGDVSATFWRSHERGGNGGTRPILDFVGGAEGTAESGSTLTLVDNQAAFGGSYVGGYVLITDGTGAGQIRQISVAAGTTLTVGTAFTTAPASGSVYVAVASGDDIVAVSNDSGAWLEESTTAGAFSLFQKADSAMDIRAAVRLIPSTHNFFASDNQAHNGTGTNAGYGNIAYFSSGYSRKRQGSEDKLLPLDGSSSNPLIVAEGVVTAATATTVTSTGAFSGDYDPDPINYRYDNPADQGSEYIISIISGAGGKQTRRIAGNDLNTVTVEEPWGVTPAPGDAFELYEIVGMPEAVNPAEGYVANWNNKAATADDGDSFGREHRVAFILERLAADSSWSRDDQRQLNKDLAGVDGRGLLGRHLVPRLREAVDAVGNGGNPLVDGVLTLLEANNAAPDYGRYFTDPLTATTTAGEVAFLNTLINNLAEDIYGDEFAGAVSVPTGSRAQNLVIHAIDAAAGTPAGAYEQQYDDYFNGADWKVVVRDALSALTGVDGIPADGVRGNSTYNHPLAALNDQLSFDPTPLGNRGTWEQIVETGPTVKGEFMFPLGQSGHILGMLNNNLTLSVNDVDPNCTSIQPIWRDWRFLPMLHVSQDLAAGDADGDGDGVFDGFERWHFGDTTRDAKDNTDGDTSALATEFARGSDPNDPDTDDDGLLDGTDGLDQDRLGSAFAKFKGLFKLPATSDKDILKLNGKFGTGATEFDAAADTLRIQVENEDGDTYYDVTVPAGTLTADLTGLKFMYKDPDGLIGDIGQLQLKLGSEPEKAATFKLATVKTNFTPPVTLTFDDLRVTVTIHDTSADADRVIIDERTWEAAGRALKSSKLALVPIYN